MDAADLGDAKILNATTVNQMGQRWVATYYDPDGADVMREFTEKPKGTMMSSFCDEVRRELSEREEVEANKKKSEAAARRASEPGEVESPGEPGRSFESVVTNREDFKKVLEERAGQNLLAIKHVHSDLALGEVLLKSLEQEKAALEAALEAYNNGGRSDTRPYEEDVRRLADRGFQSEDVQTGAASDSESSEDKVSGGGTERAD